MIYVILGIAVLVVSFIVALISLIYEQRKVDERDNFEEGKAQDELPSLDKHAKGESENAETQYSQKSYNLAEASKVPDYFVPAKPDVKTGNFDNEDDGENVWWNNISNQGTVGHERTIPSSQEEESIRAIQEELARLSSQKAGVDNPQNEPKKDGHLEPQNESKKRNLLVGEFSLDDFRNND